MTHRRRSKAKGKSKSCWKMLFSVFSFFVILFFNWDSIKKDKSQD